MFKEYIKDNGTNLILLAPYLELYIPDLYFKKKLAENKSPFLRTFGLLKYQLFNANNKPIGKMGILNIPTQIVLYPSEIEERNMTLLGDKEESKYFVCQFYKNNSIMQSEIQMDSDNSMVFLKLLLAGKITGVPYNKLLNIWEKNLEYNNMNLGVNVYALGTIISEIYRNPNNVNERFGIYSGKDPKVSQYDYVTSNPREVCARNSTFAALTFQDIDAMITTSLNMKNYNKKQSDSPIEKIIKM